LDFKDVHETPNIAESCRNLFVVLNWIFFGNGWKFLDCFGIMSKFSSIYFRIFKTSLNFVGLGTLLKQRLELSMKAN
jgi:hypothetical protein